MNLGIVELSMLALVMLLCVFGSALVGGLFYWLHLRLKRLEERLSVQEQESQGGDV